MPTSPDRPRVHETPQINRTTAHAGQPRQVNHDDPRNQNPSILGTSAPAARRITMSPPARHASAIVCLGRSSTGTFAGRRQARLLRDISGRQTTEIPFPHQLATGAARPPSLLSLPMLSRNSAISSSVTLPGHRGVRRQFSSPPRLGAPADGAPSSLGADGGVSGGVGCRNAASVSGSSASGTPASPSACGS